MSLSLHDGDQIDLGDMARLRVLETQGHAPDNIRSYMEEKDFLFISDAVGIFYPPSYVKPNFFYNLGVCKSLLQRIQDMGTKVIVQRVSEVVLEKKKIQDYLQLALRGVEEFKRYLGTSLKAGMDERKVSKDFTNTYQRGV